MDLIGNVYTSKINYYIMTYIYKTFTSTNSITDVSDQIKTYLSTAANRETAKVAMCDQNSGEARGYVITDPDLKSAPSPLYGGYNWVETTAVLSSNSDFEPKIKEFTQMLNGLSDSEAYSAQICVTNANNENGFASLLYLSK